VDIVRPEVKRKKRVRLIIYIVAAVVLIPLVTYALSRLKPAAPSVDSGTIWTDTVKRGPMLREVRGLGTLVPRRQALHSGWHASESEHGDPRS
jgi:hypothetical protein